MSTDRYPFSPGEYAIPPGEVISDVVGADVFRALSDDLTDWWHAPFKLDALHQRGARGAGVVVAILDTGVDLSHPDLAGAGDGLPHRDFTGSPILFRDSQGHGTHCAGLAAARSGNGGAVGGAPDARVLSAKVLGDSGSGRSDWTAAGIRHAADSGAGVISMSLGGPDDGGETRAALRYAISKGCWIVAAAGNEGPNTISFPGGYPESCSVAAVGPDLTRAAFSSTNREVDVAGAGVSVYSTLPGNRYGRMSGTSMATPVVAGLLAAVRSALVAAGKPVPDQNGLIAAVKVTARDLPPAGVDTGTGAGLLDPVALLDRLLAGAPVPPPAPPAKLGTVSIDLDTRTVTVPGAGWTLRPAS